ncbi:MAG: membrane dipeptidase [Alphaproteobacteria bacterium]|nr:membrane dipeptidase [Alphaproteobacteria bacterium]MCB9695873.1 membrane dipeptidase [Alphaproteobacteria bacterium]
MWWWSALADAAPRHTEDEEVARLYAAARAAELPADPIDFPLGEVLGIADLHAHQFSEHGFGGRAVFDHYPCSGEVHGLQPSFEKLVGLIQPERENKPLIERPEQVRALADSSVIESLLSHEQRSVVLQPAFDSWAHEQYAEEHLELAVAGGLRLMVVSAMSNTVLCAMTEGLEKSGSSCADADNIPGEIVDAWRFEREHADWYRVALDPVDANHTMAAGRLAVLLSTEGSDLVAGRARGGLLRPGDLRRELADDDPAPDGVIERLAGMGVRVWQGVHEWNSWAGAAAIQHAELFQGGYSLMRRRIRPPSRISILDIAGPFFGFRMAQGTLATWPMPAEITEDPRMGPYVRNSDGLTPLGGALVRDAVREGMIVDIVHLGELAADQVRVLLDGVPYILSHETVRAPTLRPRFEWEYQASDATLADLARRGGVYGLLPSGERSAMDPEWVDRMCPGSSASFAQSLLHVGRSGVVPAFGTDMNGAATMLFPRVKHPRACGAQTDPDAALQYARRMQRWAPTTESRPYAESGLAHAGLLPSLLADVRVLQGGPEPVSRRARPPVWATFLSAQRTVDVWFASQGHDHWWTEDGPRPAGDLDRCVQAALGAPVRCDQPSAYVLEVIDRLSTYGAGAGAPAYQQVDQQTFEDPTLPIWETKR